MSLLDALFRDGALRTVDHALAQALRRLDRDTPDLVLAGAALASQAIARGHAAFDPRQPQSLSEAAVEWPQPQAWLEALAQSRWVAAPAADAAADPAAPLVLEHGLLYLRRYREYERRLAAGLRRLQAFAPPPADLAALAPLFAQLFPQARDDDRQARAAALALLQSLLLATGGPGTGKTTTIARLLVLLIAQAHLDGVAPPRIALAAPTGRAAERMAQSLHAAAARLRELPAFAARDGSADDDRRDGFDAGLLDALPQQAGTLHRLLGVVPDRPRFRHDARNPLPFDIVVVDEASMVDLPLMCKLIEAVPDGARLILLGDRDQLPSVEAGDVLAAIVDAAGDDDGLPAAQAQALRPLLGDAVPVLPAPTALSANRVHLRRGYRQADSLRLAPLADAVRDGDADTALALLRSGELAGVHFHEDVHDPLAGGGRDRLLPAWRAIGDAADPEQALALAARLRLLTALRDGGQGAAPLNARIEEALAGAHRSAYFHGRLLLITENSYRHGLFNGDIGVCLRADGRDEPGAGTVAWFAGGSQGVRAFHPSALPAHSGAFAMTVHKSQGSEFERVWLQLPRQDARHLSRELVYTGMTRARSELHVAASEAVLRSALARHAARVSGLAWRLG
ncbi:DNA helicase/exodeoxyribonuclease V, alpha subunit [Lysobacter sp. yr284]|uniref:exodeoxyribonuclease V subunit alpha n=1 Tax=Lysobacter sp. yr284 TaxID=1761791 RepID=UPI0008952EA1|nr:exodeoxyribonuclease V subunit alpha [Lysobacter sp. yr284]SDY87814.1 DNA helicase/exodeoxyribonuclease V, alpha subunit [Lysobacter sp. yr284]